ncbi:tRNA1(Val) (adenine(37)-N6)-methyltransferase [Microvirga lotononidis]|uniref:Putative O-methyltransferase n=1 Tax=Microvirga lotononidis TaxID=864069 RepID=I4YQ36_9HYPH|nr:methyltransferase [Microvirga lotononidis]EIM26078.1 putative O-methyltransferase [Microvirga lotononidis]WQO25984.1 methyltransferase [Microvirga lotononidis]
MIDITEDLLLGGRVHLVQPERGHRAGTDAVLLAASAPLRPGDVVLDVGAATGAVGLMAAARQKDARFVFVERDPHLAELCRRNCRDNGVDGQVAVADVLDRDSRLAAGLASESADLVLTNPPFLEEGQARISPDQRRAAAHALPSGGLETWLKACAGLLKPKGRLVLIHRADRTVECLRILDKWFGGLELRFVHSTADRPAIRLLLSGIKGSRAPSSILPPLILNGSDGHFTPQAEALHRGEGTLA